MDGEGGLGVTTVAARMSHYGKRRMCTGFREAIAIEMIQAESDGILTPSRRTAYLEELKALDAEMQQVQVAAARAKMPVYFATSFSGLREPEAENNPLAYGGHLPAVASLALYDRPSLAANPKVGLTNKIIRTSSFVLRLQGQRLWRAAWR